MIFRYSLTSVSVLVFELSAFWMSYSPAFQYETPGISGREIALRMGKIHEKKGKKNPTFVFLSEYFRKENLFPSARQDRWIRTAARFWPTAESRTFPWEKKTNKQTIKRTRKPKSSYASLSTQVSSRIILPCSLLSFRASIQIQRGFQMIFVILYNRIFLEVLRSRMKEEIRFRSKTKSRFLMEVNPVSNCGLR